MTLLKTIVNREMSQAEYDATLAARWTYVSNIAGAMEAMFCGEFANTKDEATYWFYRALASKLYGRSETARCLHEALDIVRKNNPGFDDVLDRPNTPDMLRALIATRPRAREQVPQ